MQQEYPGTPCIGCGVDTYGAFCSRECHERTINAECEANGHVVQGDTCYCGMVVVDLMSALEQSLARAKDAASGDQDQPTIRGEEP